jgi:DcmR-like sensory protein
MRIDDSSEWKNSKTDVFWAEIAPCDHVIQIYENDAIFLDALAGFVGGGISAGDCVVVIATQQHLKALETRLLSYGIFVGSLIAEDRYIPLDAEKTLAKFMINGWPDEALFTKTVSGIIETAHKNKRRVRAFGEMVALLWAEGYSGATVHLEHLWNDFCEKAALCLFCAYPKSGFTEDLNTSIMSICGAHSKMIRRSDISLSELEYKITN